ncbi:MAG: SRPBCC family protein [Chitinophagales bacterium]|nr:SRPBCC family protein [Chitinophagales bacterium]
MAKKLVIIFSAIVLLNLIVCAFLPNTFSFQRSIEIKANKETVFGQVASFRNWRNWSPWSDSTLQITFAGPETHVGAEMLWSNDGKENDGSNKIVEFKPYNYLKIETQISKNTQALFMEFYFEEMPANTCKVVWKQSGNLTFFERPFGLFMEKIMGSDLELGLQKLKINSEALIK